VSAGRWGGGGRRGGRIGGKGAVPSWGVREEGWGGSGGRRRERGGKRA